MFKPKEADSPKEYIAQIDEPRKSEIQQLHDFIRKTIPDQKPYIVHNIIGYGTYPYKTKAGKEGEWFPVGLASQKNYISVYACCVTKDGKYIAEKYKKELPKASIGRSCIRFKKVQDIDLDVLEKIILECIEVKPESI